MNRPKVIPHFVQDDASRDVNFVFSHDMLDLKSFSQAIQQIADEKGISKEKIIEAIEMAIAAAYKRDYGKRGQIIRARLDEKSGKAAVRQIKIVVDESMIKTEEEIQAEEEERMLRAEQMPETESRRKHDDLEDDMELEGERKVRFNPEKHLMFAEAKKIKKDVVVGDELEFPLEHHDEFGRIAAQTAKQVVIQRIREMEREAVYDEFKKKEGEIVNGIIQRLEGRAIFVDIGRTVAVLPPEEQIPHERYRMGERMKALVVSVEKNPRGPGIFLSRTHPRILRKFFEIEVPEIASGVVEVKAIAREPGSRSKIAAFSHESGVDPVGSLVGQKGIRVSTVINELGGEKIDVIEWSEDPAEFIANALSPANVLEVELAEGRREAKVTVPHEQLSLAIGRGGQNVRLAAKLTGWKLDVRSDRATGEGASADPDEDEVTIEAPLGMPESAGKDEETPPEGVSS